MYRHSQKQRKTLVSTPPKTGPSRKYNELKRHSGGVPCRKVTQAYHMAREPLFADLDTVLVLVLCAIDLHALLSLFDLVCVLKAIAL